MKRQNKKKTVWITGASSGIGRETALAYARDGNTVFASARSKDELKKLAKESRRLSGKIIPLALDVTRAESIRKALKKIALGPDISILNAGTYYKTPAEDFKAKDFEKLMKVNFLGTVNCLESLLPVLGNKGGQVAIVASVAGYVGLPYAAGYGASKAALINLCESLRPELATKNIDLRLIDPGFIKTPLTDKNEFPMPFLMEADKAAQRILKGLESNRFEITFPKRFTWIMKFLRILPCAIRLRIMKSMLKKAG